MNLAKVVRYCLHTLIWNWINMTKKQMSKKIPKRPKHIHIIFIAYRLTSHSAKVVQQYLSPTPLK